MQIVLPGTSGADGMPGLFCGCDTCRAARKFGGKDRRARASALINNDLKIDFGPDVAHSSQTHGLDLSELKYLLFTHGHDDHFAPSELQYLGRYFIRTPDQPLQIYGPDDVLRRIWCTYQHDALPIELNHIEAFQTVHAGPYRITPIRANHVTDQECFNHIIQDQRGNSVLYATDTGWWGEETWDFLSEISVDAVVLECGMGPVGNLYAGHLCLSEFFAVREKLIQQKTIALETPFVATHISHTGGWLHGDYEREFAPHGITTGFDGLRLDLSKR